MAEIRDISPKSSPLQRLRDRTIAPAILRHPFRWVVWLVGFVMSLAGGVMILAILASIPIVNLLVLGYFLESEGRVARSGDLRQGFPLRHLIPRLTTIFLGICAVCLPLWIASGIARDAEIIAPNSVVAQRWKLVTGIVSLILGGHLFLSLAYGGNLGSFLRPIRNLRWFLSEFRRGTLASTIAEGIVEFARELRVVHHFRLGLQGYLAALVWLVIPTFLFASLRKTEGPSTLVVLLGGVLLVLVLSWMPFLQARLIAEKEWRGGFQLRSIRELSRRAPYCWLLATVLTYALSLPLYLTTVVLPPLDALWIVNLLFVLCIFPARLSVGWAYAQAARRVERARWYWRWSANALVLPLLGVYVFLLYFSQLIGQHGKLVLFEHPALLLPVPF